MTLEGITLECKLFFVSYRLFPNPCPWLPWDYQGGREVPAEKNSRAESTVCLRTRGIHACLLPPSGLCRVLGEKKKKKDVKNSVQEHKWPERFNFKLFFPEEHVTVVWGPSIPWPQVQ